MGRLIESMKRQLEEQLAHLYEERDRLREAHKKTKKLWNEDRLTGLATPEDARRWKRKLRDDQQWRMDVLFDKIREVKRVLDRINGRDHNGRTNPER